MLNRNPTALLHGTPYLIEDGPGPSDRFKRVFAEADQIHDRALRASERITRLAQDMLAPYEMTVRSELVAESNRLEGYDVAPKDVRKLAELTSGLEARSGYDLLRERVLEHVRDDERLLASLGLYRAYEIADRWGHSSERPREFEVRELHSTIMASTRHAGRYKIAPNEIGGSAHVPVPPWEVPPAMHDLMSWFVEGSGEPVLDAAVAHAWLTHIHPFDDGNGRMARLLANLALIQSHFPPLLLRSKADRGQYLDALAASDEGDILPLYELFTHSLRRLVKTMERENYVEKTINRTLLSTTAARYDLWRQLLQHFSDALQSRLRQFGWRVCPKGELVLEGFSLLEQRDSDGNGWYATLAHGEREEWLLWFGYRSRELVDIDAGGRNWPSIFLSSRESSPEATYPFAPVADFEMSLVPVQGCQALIRHGFESWEGTVSDAVTALAKRCQIVESR